MKSYVVRKNYLNKIREFKEKNLIKVITGVRRSGKSVLLEQFQEELKNDGIKDSQIISLNFERIENEDLLDYKKLHTYITDRLNKDGWTYIFLDEIQMVEQFQKAINSLHTNKNVDIYLTGSNSYMLSGELATLLSGRYVEIHVLPLSFKEYIIAKNYIKFERGESSTASSDIMNKALLLKSYETITIDDEKLLAPQYGSYKDIYRQEFENYIRNGSFPQTLELKSQKSIYDYLDSVYNTVVVKDILARGKSVQESVLSSIIKFILHNIGSEVSSVNIANTLTSNNRKVSYNTVETYLGYLKDSFVIYEAPRYDVKGKQHLKSNAKYYAVDTGLRNMMLYNKETDIGHLLENIVYLELIRREYKISVGKVDLKEVDFVAQNENETVYFQVATSLLDKKTLDRELASLNAIKDHYPKFIITLDDYMTGNTYNGIRVVHAIDFLLENY